MNELPPGWEWSTVGEVASVQLGRQRSPKNHSGPYMRPYLRSANITWRGIDVSDVKEMNFAPEEAKTFELTEGDILLNEASGSPKEVGKPAIWRGEIPGACFQNTLLRVRSNGPDRDYLFWYLYASALSGRFGEAGRGVNIRHLGKQGLTSFKIPIPPRPEQERIVAAIEESFSRLDAAEADLRSALMRSAALIQSTLIASIPTDSLPSAWDLVTVDEAGATDLGRQRAPKYHQGESMRPYLRVANVFEDRLDLADIMEMDFDDEAWCKYQLADGDILLNEGQSPHLVGRPAMYRGDPPEIAFTNSLIRFRANDDVNPDWALLVFRRHLHARRFMREASITTNIAHLALKRFRTVEFPKPPVGEQRRLVDQIEGDLAAVERIKTEIQKNLKRISASRRSILAAAFLGRLVPEDPTDEPASILLARISAEDAATRPLRRKTAAPGRPQRHGMTTSE